VFLGCFFLLLIDNEKSCFVKIINQATNYFIQLLDSVIELFDMPGNSVKKLLNKFFDRVFECVSD